MDSLADARLKRDQNKRLLAEGIDPIEAAKVSKAKATNASYRKFDDAAEQCIDALSAQWSNAKHRQQWTNTLRTYASPVIGQLDVAEIDTNLILNVLQIDAAALILCPAKLLQKFIDQSTFPFGNTITT